MRSPQDRGERRSRALADFTITASTLRVIAPAIAIGIAATPVAAGLIALIGLITHLAYSGTIATGVGQPDVARLGALSVLVPVVGGLLIGLMARLGSERIRGHGIPEAMETILIGGSRMEPRLALLKPISSAISIGTGGPFGAEGPIIVTGGALGSIAGQLMHLTAVERRTLLVAGAAAGMTAVFGTPLSAVLLSVELLLFEWRPRSLLPVALAVCAAESARGAMASAGMLPAAPIFGSLSGGGGGLPVELAAGAVVVGLAAGALAWVLTRCVYAAEDMFKRLRLHWMWWPALGGLIVGAGGLIEPRALGVGYAAISAELTGRLALSALLVLLLVKLSIWSIALGSTTSGGVLAPVLMIGAALGGLLGAALPGAADGTWALIGMAATLGAVTGSPLTGIVFAIESTHDLGALPALLAACAVSHLVGSLTMRRSILTEKIARRGVHVHREYDVDPLQALLARDLARPLAGESTAPPGPPVRADATLRAVADEMLISGRSELAVHEGGRMLGSLSEADLLRARERVLIEERRRERPLRPWPSARPGPPSRQGRTCAPMPVAEPQQEHGV